MFHLLTASKFKADYHSYTVTPVCWVKRNVRQNDHRRNLKTPRCARIFILKKIKLLFEAPCLTFYV